MNTSKPVIVALGSLLAFTAACSGGAASVGDGAPEGSAPSVTSPVASSVPPPPPSGVDSGSPAQPASDAGAPDAHVDPPMALHCTGSLAEPNVCIENAQGHPGDVVDVAIVLQGSSLCTVAGEATGHMAYDLVQFSIDNQVEQVGCRTRHVGPGMSGSDNLQWNAFGEGSLAGCPNTLPLGTVDVVKVKIAAGTPAGDYKLTWADSGFIGSMSGPPACTTIGMGIGGTLRVLP